MKGCELESRSKCQDGVCVVDDRSLVSIDGLSVYYGQRQVLNDVKLEARSCTITALIGPSGCGKSSFLACLNRMSDMVPGCRVTGSVRIGETDVMSPKTNLQMLRRRVGMIFQKPNPFPLTIRENLALPLRHHGVRDKDAIDATIEQSLAAVGLWDEVKDRLGAPAMSLSGGQQQRLCIARALSLKPEVVLLDEPCSALDPLSSATVEEMIRELRRSYTVLIVTHNLAQARRIADHTGFFWVKNGAGQLVEFGKTEQLFESPRDALTAAYVTGRAG